MKIFVRCVFFSELSLFTWLGNVRFQQFHPHSQLILYVIKVNTHTSRNLINYTLYCTQF